LNPGDAQLERLRRFAYWLDSGIPLPGTSFRFGLDPIIGLIPGVGDAAGAILSGWILLAAARRGLPRITLVRMAINIGIDAVVGAIPILGDAFDFVWKANVMNVGLIERHLADPIRAKKGDRLFLLLLAGAVTVICGGVAVGGLFLAARLLQLVTGR
jgi:hypothetical protein